MRSKRIFTSNIIYDGMRWEAVTREVGKGPTTTISELFKSPMNPHESPAKGKEKVCQSEKYNKKENSDLTSRPLVPRSFYRRRSSWRERKLTCSANAQRFLDFLRRSTLSHLFYFSQIFAPVAQHETFRLFSLQSCYFSFYFPLYLLVIWNSKANTSDVRMAFYEEGKAKSVEECWMKSKFKYLMNDFYSILSVEFSLSVVFLAESGAPIDKVNGRTHRCNKR